jgi:hypothetical protein
MATQTQLGSWMLAREHIDRRRLRLRADSRYRSFGAQAFVEPEVYIIHSHPGRLLFNAFMRQLGETEVNARPIRGNVQYPYHVLSLSWIDRGHLRGLWEHFGDFSALEREVVVTSQQDDFTAMAEEMRRALRLASPLRVVASAG